MSPDIADLLRALTEANARFLVVGAYAVGIHGHPRATKDFDVWVEASEENAPRVLLALQAFGAPLMGLTEGELRRPGVGLQIGVPPGRIDLLTKISGVEFVEAWPRRLEANVGDLTCGVLGLEDLLRNKRASARPQDLADVAALERLQRLT
jgi:hypothetical protein